MCAQRSIRDALRLLAVMVCGGVWLSGCIAVGGTDQHTYPTMGRQLMDLKVARDTGAIDDHEYHRVKSQLLSAK